MSTRTITFKHKVAGVLTDVTSAVLSDPTDAFGVKRNDTSAVVVANNTAMTRIATGTYQHTFTEPAAGLAYTAYIEWVYNSITHRVEKQLAAVTLADAPIYNGSLDAADALAAPRAGFTTFKATSNGATRLAALLTAAERIDAAMPYQGKKYGLAVGETQIREFPRLARGSVSAIDAHAASALGIGAEVWDWDDVENEAVVPERVKLAELHEAEAILSGTSAERERIANAIASGLSSQSLGDASESYVRTAVTADGRPKLCSEAHRIMAKYLARSGGML